MKRSKPTPIKDLEHALTYDEWKEQRDAERPNLVFSHHRDKAVTTTHYRRVLPHKTMHE